MKGRKVGDREEFLTGVLEAIAKYTLEWDMFPSLKNWDSFAYHAVFGLSSSGQR